MHPLHRPCRISCIALAVILTTAFVSCSDDEEASDDSAPSSTAEAESVVSSAATDGVDTVATDGSTTMITTDDDTAPGGGSDDGCTVSTMEGQAPGVIHRDHTTELESGRAFVSPDGESVIVRIGLQNVLQSAGEEDDDPVELPDGNAVFVDRS